MYSIDMQQAQLNQKAYGLGVEAFMSGKSAVPAQDKNLGIFLRENHIKVGSGLELIHLWIKGYVEA